MPITKYYFGREYGEYTIEEMVEEGWGLDDVLTCTVRPVASAGETLAVAEKRAEALIEQFQGIKRQDDPTKPLVLPGAESVPVKNSRTGETFGVRFGFGESQQPADVDAEDALIAMLAGK